MSNPLPDSTVLAPQTCETAALAAAMIIAGSFPEVLDFAAGQRAKVLRARRRTSETSQRAAAQQRA
jgi:hypothetical protein